MASEVRVAETTQTVEERLAALEQAVADVGGQVNEMTEETITPAELTVVPGLEVCRPIPIVLEEYAEDVLARWVEPHIWGLGGSEGEAIESLAEVICEIWADLHDDSMELSGNAHRILAVMETYVAPTA